MTLTSDDWPAETSWRLLAPDGSTVLSGEPQSARAVHTTRSCVHSTAPLLLVVADTGANGLCCEAGDGRFELRAGQRLVASASEFGAEYAQWVSIGGGAEAEAEPPACTLLEDGRDYRGTVNVSASGRPCAPWPADLIDRRGGTGIESAHTFCRNPAPGRLDRPWCYVGPSADSSQAELCNIAACASGGAPTATVHFGPVRVQARAAEAMGESSASRSPADAPHAPSHGLALLPVAAITVLGLLSVVSALRHAHRRHCDRAGSVARAGSGTVSVSRSERPASGRGFELI